MDGEFPPTGNYRRSPHASTPSGLGARLREPAHRRGEHLAETRSLATGPWRWHFAPITRHSQSAVCGAKPAFTSAARARGGHHRMHNCCRWLLGKPSFHPVCVTAQPKAAHLLPQRGQTGLPHSESRRAAVAAWRNESRLAPTGPARVYDAAAGGEPALGPPGRKRHEANQEHGTE